MSLGPGIKKIFHPLSNIPFIKNIDDKIETSILGRPLLEKPEGPGVAPDKFTGFVPTDAFAGTQGTGPKTAQVTSTAAATRRRKLSASPDSQDNNTLLGG